MPPAHLVVSLEVPVAWGEQDLFGHVNNIVYFRYFESVRMHYLDRIGVLRSHQESGIGVILASTTCDFKKPVTWPQRLTIRTGATGVGNTSFTMDYLITDEQGEAVATGTSVQVMYDYSTASKIRVTEEVRAAIQRIQQPSV
jgi:acyl-CoA thioester hydrolase